MDSLDEVLSEAGEEVLSEAGEEMETESDSHSHELTLESENVDGVIMSMVMFTTT